MTRVWGRSSASFSCGLRVTQEPPLAGSHTPLVPTLPSFPHGSLLTPRSRRTVGGSERENFFHEPKRSAQNYSSLQKSRHRRARVIADCCRKAKSFSSLLGVGTALLNSQSRGPDSCPMLFSPPALACATITTLFPCSLGTDDARSQLRVQTASHRLLLV